MTVWTKAAIIIIIIIISRTLLLRDRKQSENTNQRRSLMLKWKLTTFLLMFQDGVTVVQR